LLLLYDAEHGLGVGSVWQVVVPEMRMQYSHFRPMRPCALEPEAVTAALELELTELAWVRFGYWTHMRHLSDEDSP
jgi:hypothetical protein